MGKGLNLQDLLQEPPRLQNLRKERSEGEAEDWFRVMRVANGTAVSSPQGEKNHTTKIELKGKPEEALRAEPGSSLHPNRHQEKNKHPTQARSCMHSSQAQSQTLTLAFPSQRSLGTRPVLNKAPMCPDLD